MGAKVEVGGGDLGTRGHWARAENATEVFAGD